MIDLENSLNDTDNDTLAATLGPNTTFSLQIIPPKGAVLFIERTTPVSLDTITSLD